MPATARRSARRPARRADAISTLDRVEAIARNLWWTWHLPAKRLIESLDPALYHAANNNPIATIRRLSPTRRDFLNSDAAFAERVASVERDWHTYMTARSWFDRTAKGAEKKAKIAYFCMEFAVQECLPLYAGGLGVLAGDHLKSASDLGVPLVAVGILWRKGYYRQEITADGSTRVLYPESNFDELPVHDTGVSFRVTLGKHTPLVKIWRMDVGRVPVYLMDTDLPENPPKVRRFTHHLYAGGDPEYRIQQEMLLGVGGLAALDAMGVEPTVLHLNEGHAAFCGMERVRRLREKSYSIERAIKAVRASTVFTTHTPVPEGNDRFDAKAVWPYIGPIAAAAGLDRERALGWGREDPSDKNEQFCMTVLALKLAEHCNGVAELHGDTARKMWLRTYGASDPRHVPIGHVTNGIHPPTWISDDAHDFYAKHLKPRWVGAGPDADPWANAERIPAEELWHLRNRLRRRLIGFLRERIREQVLYHEGGDAQLASYYDELRDDALTIGFARRFATYKRAPLMFSQPKKLAELLGDPARPVQILFAGKAHPMDDAGKAFVQKVWQMSRRPEFRGKIFLLQNYDMEIGRMLTQGCDLWLNNPVRPMEASGTSGMKCPLNAGLNCSILDGWWPEGYDGKNGFSLGGEQFRDRAKQDRHDAARIYEVLGGEVIPEFYRRGRDGVPSAWCKRVARAMRTQCAQFSTHRMVAEYLEGYYLPAHASR